MERDDIIASGWAGGIGGALSKAIRTVMRNGQKGETVGHVSAPVGSSNSLSADDISHSIQIAEISSPIAIAPSVPSKSGIEAFHDGQKWKPHEFLCFVYPCSDCLSELRLPLLAVR